MKALFALGACMITGLLHAQQPQQEDPQSSKLLYQAPPRIMLQEQQGPDGDEPARPARLQPLKRNVQPQNRRAVLQPAQSLIITEADAPGIRQMAMNAVCAAPIVEADLEPVYASAKANMPLYLPYKAGKVGIWQGFYYSWDKDKDGNNDIHRAIDYGKSNIDEGEDPTFAVYAIAAGKVIDVKWANGGGNTIVVEHTAPNGSKYRSSYLHLRNGHDNDRKLAQASTSEQYRNFATNGTNSNLCWGTNSQTIAVKKGDAVYAGQFLAWAGNTGSGGMGAALDSTGALKKPDTRSFNVHLHFEVRIPDTRPGHTGEWVRVDPYGVYNVASVDCYGLEDYTPYARLFAPFYPNFHGVPLDIVNKFWSYYTGMGMALQTVSVDKSGSSLYAAGSFQWGLPGAWYARFYMTAPVYQHFFNTYNKQGFRPRQISVTKDGSGNPRFSVIWEKNAPGQSFAAVHNSDDASFNAVWNDYVKTKKWHVQEHVAYTVSGKRYHAAVFVNKPNDNGFYLYYGMKGPDFDSKFKELYKNWELKSLHVDGNTVGGVWRPKQHSYAAYYGMSPADYQQKFNQYSAQGLRLIKVQSYDDNERYSAIWAK